MISGFNTDIEYEGVTYHVQTEDKGLETPFLLSLVYTRGEILAAKRSPYEDLLAAGFDESVLAERLQKQHRLICAAIKQGRLEDLKRMSAREPVVQAVVVTQLAAQPQQPDVKSEPLPLSDLELFSLDPFLETPIALIEESELDDELPEPPLDLTDHSVRVLRTESGEQVADFARAEHVPSDALNLLLLDEREFSGGDRVALRIQITQGYGTDEKNIFEAEVIVKVLGAAFRPVLLHSKTDANGIAVLHLQFPHFRTGRAALLIRAAYGGYAAELRRIVTQG